MADSVQYVMDRLAAHFRQLEELELFSKEEVRSIVKKRTDYEYVMKRRQLFPEDFYAYLQYEINLDKLRAIRCEKFEKVLANKDKQDTLRNIKSMSSRHICSVFDRAVRRFPNNMDLWTDYIAYLKETKSNSILNTIFGKALSLHPKNEDFWMQSAVHELEINNNVHAARTLFQRALRVNKGSKKLWLRYFELELWSASKVSERSRILGLEGKKELQQEDSVSGAPAVVFKHALLANPTDLELACDMHSSADQVNGPLALAFEEQIRDKFGAKSALWGYLTRRHTAQIAQIAESDLCSSTSTKKKRRRKDEEGGGDDDDPGGGANVVAVATTSMGKIEQILALLVEGKKSVTEGGVASELAVFRVLEVATLCECLESILPVANSLGLVGEVREDKKKRKSGASSSASGTIGAVVAVLEVVASRLAEYCSGGVAALDKLLADKTDVTTVPLFITVCCARFRLHCVTSALTKLEPSVAISPTLSQQSSLDCRALAGRLELTAQLLVRLKALGSVIGSAAWERGIAAVKSWSEALQLCNQASEDDRTALLQARQKPGTGRGTAAVAGNANQVVRAVAQAGIAGLTLAVCCEEGCVALGDTLTSLELTTAAATSPGQQAARGGTTKEVKDKYWKAIIACTHLMPLGRGDWCARLVRLVGERARSAPGATDVDVSRAIRAVFEWIESVLKVSAPAAIGGDLTEFYAATLDEQVRVLRSLGFKKASASETAFARVVAERATSICPSEVRFWDAWEDLERQLGDHGKANHVLWKKGKA